jgi:hypothetical protein
MTLTPKHEQFVVDTGLDDHLADNSETLIEILTAIGDQKAMTALSNLLSGTVCCARCHARDVRLVIECLCAAHDVPTASLLQKRRFLTPRQNISLDAAKNSIQDSSNC